MVARIRSGKSLKGAINYNEQKVKNGQAILIMAKGYPKQESDLNFHEKLNRLQKLADLNTRTETHCLHLSLNFDISEKLSPDKLKAIAEVYMEGIGFGKQPYLLYLHNDAAHSHGHIVSTNIQKDGKRISLHNLGKLQSEKIRKEIEIKFGLVKAGDRQQRQLHPLRPVNIEKAVYGKSETKRAITNIVNQVIAQYKFASLPELNAVLSQYNVIADKGGEGTRMNEKGGLQYSIVDSNGTKVGIPIKASSIYDSPTLKRLQPKFELNKKLKESNKAITKSMISVAIQESQSKAAFIARLKTGGIDVLLRRNEQGFIYGITYVDHKSKCVFNGSELGKEFSAATIRDRWEPSISSSGGKGQESKTREFQTDQPALSQANNMPSLLEELASGASGSGNQVPYPYRKRRKRRNRKL